MSNSSKHQITGPPNHRSTESSTLGVVAISYNEEQDLPCFLDNLLPWVDEIVIVDDGSTDQTASIAQAAGEKVNFITSKRNAGEYYADQRNKGIDAATSDWLLHMDIDERVPPEMAVEILQAIKSDKKDGYRYRRTNYFLHRPMKGGGWQDWNLIHLARRDLFRFGGMFHESCHLDAPEKRVGQLKNRMLHYNDETFSERLRKSQNYLPEIVERIIHTNRKVTMLSLIIAVVKEFIKKYLFKKGFQDGTPGLISALHSTTAVFRAQALVWDKQNQISRESLESQLSEQWQKHPVKK